MEASLQGRWLLLLQVLLCAALVVPPLGVQAQESDEDSPSEDDDSTDNDEATEEEPKSSDEGASSKGEGTVPPSTRDGAGASSEEGAESQDGDASATVAGKTARPGTVRGDAFTSARAQLPARVGTPRWIVGFDGTGMASLHEGRSPAALGGPGAFVQMLAVPGELQIELAARFLIQPEVFEVPVGVLLEKPWDVKNARFYLGVGPALVVRVPTPAAGEGAAQAPEEVAARFGFVGVGGLTYWLRPRVGLSVELDYNIVIDSGATHELGASLGLAFAL